MRAIPRQRPRLGLIVLQPDETIEDEFRQTFSPALVALHVSRVPSGDAVTPESLAAMEAHLPQAAGLLPRAAGIDVVGYACTSGTMTIGAARVAQLVRQGIDTRAVTDPLTAACAAMNALGIRRPGLVSPYIDAVARPLQTAFEGRGLSIAGTTAFGIAEEATVARLAPADIADAARALAARCGCDGLFLSCTNLRTWPIIDALEADLGLPVLSSNLALAWHMAELVGIAGRLPGPGRLLRTD